MADPLLLAIWYVLFGPCLFLVVAADREAPFIPRWIFKRKNQFYPPRVVLLLIQARFMFNLARWYGMRTVLLSPAVGWAFLLECYVLLLRPTTKFSRRPYWIPGAPVRHTVAP